MNILITDGDNRSALAATRSLGKKGHSVYVAAGKARSLASCSRFCHAGLAVPDPMIDGPAYAAAVNELLVQKKIDAIFPMTEQSIYLLNPLRQKSAQKTLFACPHPEMMEAVSNKAELFRQAQKLQVAIPRTWQLASAEDLANVINDIGPYPVVVKPAFSRISTAKGFLSGGVRYAADRDELEKMYAKNPILQYPTLIQEKIVGPGTGLFTLYDRNKHLALFSHKRLREKPPSGGVSVVSQSVPLDEEMVAAADRLLSSVGFTGVAMVEFKWDQQDGKAKLMEINGRFWGTLQLAIACGVDFPGLYVDYLQGKEISRPSKEYKTGHKMKWLLGTFDHVLIRLKNRDETLNLPHDAPTKFQSMLHFLKMFERNNSFDVAHLRDLRPFIHELACYYKALRKSG